MKILLVEDDVRVRRMIRQIVGHLAEVILECEDGGTAIDLYRKYQPDWVLMDLVLRNVDGIDACRAIREADPEARVVIVTSHDSDRLRNAAKEAGALKYVLKEDLTQLPSELT